MPQPVMLKKRNSSMKTYKTFKEKNPKKMSFSLSVQFSPSVLSDSLQCHESQDARSPVHHQPPEFTQTHFHQLVMPFSHLILCHPLFLLPPIPPSIRVFSNELTLRMRWPKYWSFSFSIIPSKEIPGLIHNVI